MVHVLLLRVALQSACGSDGCWFFDKWMVGTWYGVRNLALAKAGRRLLDDLLLLALNNSGCSGLHTLERFPIAAVARLKLSLPRRFNSR